MENPGYRGSLPIQPEDTQEDSVNNVNEQDDIKCEEFDQLLKIVGSKGKYQKLLLYAVICPVTFIQPFIFLNAIFLLNQPDHWCYVPGRNNATISLDDWKTLNIPLDLERVDSDGHPKFSRCEMFDHNHSIVGCQMGWEYDQRDYKSTLISHYNWVCEKSEWGTYSMSIQSLGSAVGTVVFGSLADRWGRKPIFFSTILTNVVFRLVSLHIVGYPVVFFVLQFLIGTAFPTMFITPTIIAAEISDKDFRGIIQCSTWIAWVIGMGIMPLVTYMAREWYIIGLVTTLPGLGIFLFWFAIPESPRWLHSVGRFKESAEILMKIAGCNGMSSNKFTVDTIQQSLQRIALRKDETTAGFKVWCLFSRFRLAKNTILLTLCWSINFVVYYSITLHSNQMSSGNQFVNFTIVALIEIPSGLTCAYLVGKIGRRWVQSFFFLICFIASVGTSIVVQYSHVAFWEIILVAIAKFAVTITYLIVYLQGTEIFPTGLRSTGSGFASTVAGGFGMLSPIIAALGTRQQSYPYLIMSSLCFVGMLCAAFIPETLRQNLPETIDEANEFGRFNKFWSLYPTSKSVPEPITLADDQDPSNNNPSSNGSGVATVSM